MTLAAGLPGCGYSPVALENLPNVYCPGCDGPSRPDLTVEIVPATREIRLGATVRYEIRVVNAEFHQDGPVPPELGPVTWTSRDPGIVSVVSPVGPPPGGAVHRCGDRCADVTGVSVGRATVEFRTTLVGIPTVGVLRFRIVE